MGNGCLLAPAHTVLARLQRYRAARGNDDWRRTGPTRDLGHMGAAGAHRSIRALPVLRLRRAGVHEFPVGPAVARSWLPGDLPHGWLAHCRLALSLARFPFSVPCRRHEAAFRRPDVAQPDGP